MSRDDILAITRRFRTRELVDLVGRLQDPFGNQESGGELFVIAWRSHGCRESLAADANFERFFDGEVVVMIFERSILLSPDNLTRTNTVFFHWIETNGIMTPVEICHLYISQDHNFFGHHGREPDTHPEVEVPSIECVAGHGIRGDRFFDFQEDYKGQVTFFSLEVFDELCAALEVQKCSPGSVRRNVFTRDVDLNTLIGKDFEVQGVRFHGTGECRPCEWMNRAVAPGAEEFLKGRGGLRARILTDGTLHSTASKIEAISHRG